MGKASEHHHEAANHHKMAAKALQKTGDNERFREHRVQFVYTKEWQM